MSELKAYKMVDEKYCTDCLCVIPSEVYLKSEADKVIADLEESNKKEVEQLLILNREQANAANRLRDSMEQVIRHQKYKRCLAMALWCDSEANYWYDSSKVLQCWRYGHYIRWFNKLSKLAEKFKEAK